MKTRVLFLILLALGFSMTVRAEEKELELLYFNHGDSVSLRWAPTSEPLFAKSIQHGYVVQRRKEGEANWTSLSSVLKPASNRKLEEMEVLDENAAALREVLYHKGRDAYKEVKDTTQRKGKNTLESGDSETSLEDQLLYGMALFSCDLSLPVAKAAALHYVDKSVVKGEKYQYRVVFGCDEKKPKANVSVVSVDTKVPTTLPTPKGFNAKFDEWTVLFNWSVSGFDGYYSAYRIERSTDKVHYKPVTKRPIIQSYTTEELKDLATYQDSLPNQDSVFYYRMSGYSPFGIYGPTSNVVSGSGTYNFKQIEIRIDTVVYNDKKGYGDVKWSVDKKFEKRIKGFQIEKTADFKKFQFLNKTLLPAGKRTFRDSKLDKANYYAVVAYGYKEGEVTNSPFYFGFRTDTVPPEAPTGLKAEVDSAGVVRVSWKANKEEDILGYRLYVSNSGRDNEYYTATDTIYKKTNFIDTLNLNTLTNEIYYKVLAVDNRYNSSQLSAAVKAVKPDKTAPVGVVFNLLSQPKSEVVVKWENSPSDDALYMELYRQVDDTGKVVLIKRYDIGKKKTPTTYEDPYAFSGEVVQYFMTVYDKAGNATQSKTDRLQTKGERPNCISDLKVVITNLEKNKQIRLSWKNNASIHISRFAIYRKEDDGRMLPVASVRSNQTFYEDKSVAVGGKYVYIVRPISTDRVCKAVYSEPTVFEGALK